LRGTPYLYYGEEIGMRDIPLSRDEILDPPGKRYWPFYRGRDGCRSPMQWNNSANAGFSNSRPWLPVHPNYLNRNVALQLAQPGSLLNFTRRLIALRRENPTLRRGDFQPLIAKPREALLYLRQTSEQKLLVAMNFRNKPAHIPLAQTVSNRNWQVLLSTSRNEASFKLADQLELASYEVLLLGAC
jgi:alpha-glucosidase